MKINIYINLIIYINVKNVSRETKQQESSRLRLLPRCLWMWGVKEKDMGGLTPFI